MRTTTHLYDTDTPKSYHWVAMPETDPNWRLDADGKCRAGASRYKRACGRDSVAAFYRGNWSGGGSWWTYCEQHLYGRWIEDGQVWHWVLREIGNEAL